MKRFCDLLTRRRSNKKVEMIKSSINPSTYSYSDQTSTLFNRQTRCTCHYFVNHSFEKNSNENDSTQTELTENPSEMKYILTVEDFCFWHDVRSTLLELIEQVVAIDETRHRPNTSIAIQTSSNHEQRRNAKIQANTVTLFPLPKSNISSSKIFLH